MKPIKKPQLVYDLPEAKYHSDPVEGGSLSSTGAKRLLEAPAVYKWHLDHPEPPRAEFDVGSAVHSYVLGTGALPVDHGHDSLRTKAARESAAKIRAEGNIPVNAKELKEIKAVADAVMDHPVAGPLFSRKDAQPEVSGFAEYEGHWLRARFDWLITGSHIAVDLKTAAGDISPRAFQRTAVDLAYDVQKFHYRRVYEQITGHVPTFVHVVVSKRAPHLVAVHELDAEFMDLARGRWERAFARYKHGKETGQWPGLPAVVNKISPPQWALYAEEEEDND